MTATCRKALQQFRKAENGPRRGVRKLSRWLGLAMCSVATAVPAAPAPEPAAVMALLRQQDEAVLRVGERLAIRGRALCPPGGRAAGMAIQRLDQFGGPYRDAARDVLGIANRPTVAIVVPGSAAAAAGLRAGDQLFAVDGAALGQAEPLGGRGSFAGIGPILDTIDAALADGAARFDILRGGVALAVDLRPEPACRARFEMRAGRSANASSDGFTVQVSSDLVAEAADDAELAAIIAHELAHNILRHPQRLKGRESALSVRSSEVAADRLSVYLLDAAGYGSGGAISFWNRWGRARDLGIFADRSHPGWKKRVATFEAEAAWIAAERAAGRSGAPPADLLR